MEDSLNASAPGLNLVDQARKRLGWNRQSVAWAEQALTSVASLKQFWRGERIQRETFVRICQAVGLDWQTIAQAVQPIPTIPLRPIQIDWGEAPEVTAFWGRAAELEQLAHWVVGQRCKLVTLLGMGGMGKTSLAVRLVEQVHPEFTGVIWRSLRNQPPLDLLLADVLRCFAPIGTEGTPTLDQQLTHLLTELRQHRWLLILDNAESILLGGAATGEGYQPGYAAYGELLRRVAEERHQSCLILTSRELPKSLTRFAGDKVQTLQLPGLAIEAGQQIFTAVGLPTTAADAAIITHYAGNPLALKIVAAAIRDLLNRNVQDFLGLIAQGALGFSDIQDLLARHYDRLSPLEQEVVHWLAIVREPIALPDLQSHLLSPEAGWQLGDTLASLKRRSLLEITPAGVTLQPSVMEYITHRLITQITDELVTALAAVRESPAGSGPSDGPLAAESGWLLRHHALVQATTQDYVRETQLRLIVGPVVDRLRARLDPAGLPIGLGHLLDRLRGQPPQQAGYWGGNLLNLLIALEVNLAQWDLSDRVLWQADLRSIDLSQVNLAQSDLSHCAFTEIFGSVLSVAFSPDGKTLAHNDDRGWVSLWEVETGQPLLSFQAHPDWGFALAFSPDGQWLATGSLDRTVKLWSIATGVCQQTIQLHRGGISAVAFSPIAPILASSSADQTIQLFNFNTGKALPPLVGHGGIVRAIAFSPKGTQLASASLDHRVKLWDISTGTCRGTLVAEDEVYAVVFLTETLVAWAGTQGLITVWDLDQDRCHTTLVGHRDRVWSLATVGATPLLVSGGEDGTVKLWDGQTGQCLKTLTGHQSRVWAVAVSPDGQTIASGGDDKTVRLWHQRGHCLRVRSGYHNSTAPIAVVADQLYTFSTDQILRRWQISTDACLQALALQTQTALQASLSPDGTLLATASLDCTIHLVSLTATREPVLLRGHRTWVRSVTFDATGQHLASAGGDRTLRLWEVATGACRHVLSGHQSPVQVAVFHPTQPIVASGSWDQTVKLWSVVSGDCVQTLREHDDRIAGLQFTPEGQSVISGSKDHTIRVWDWSSGDCVQVLTGHQAGIVAIALSPDGQQLASAGQDGTIRLWDLPAGDCLSVLPGCVSYSSSLIFSPDGAWLASGGEDGTVTLWSIAQLAMGDGDCGRVLQVSRPYEGMTIAGVKGITGAQIAMLINLGATIAAP